MSSITKKGGPSSTAQSASAGARPRRASVLRSQRRAAAWFVVPFMVLYAVVYLAPIVYSVVQSLYSRRNTSSLGFGGIETIFVGLKNYASVVEDQEFWASLVRIFLLGVVQIPVMLLVAVVLALLLDSANVRGAKVFRLLFFLPYAIPGVVAGILWSYLYGPTLSPIVAAFDDVGLSVNFLGQRVVLWSIANIILWSFAGYNMLIALSALQAIPRELFEAARIDGASEWQLALLIKLPHLRPALILSGTLSIIGTLQTFNEPQVLSVISPFVTSKYVPTMAALDAAFGRNDFGLAAATSVVIALIAGVLSLIYYQVTTRRS